MSALKIIKHWWKKLDTNKWKHILCSWIRRQYYQNIPNTQNNLQIKCNPYWNPSGSWYLFLYRNRKTVLKLIWNCNGPGVAKSILRKNNKAGNITFSDFKIYYKTIVIKQYGTSIKQTCRSVAQKSLEINSCIYSQLIFTKGAKNTLWEKG